MSHPSHADAGIVTTLRHAGKMLDSFVSWHLAQGFKHLFLFFDDPADPDIARVAAHPSISVIPHDAALQRAWQKLPEMETHGPHIATDVMARQILNAALAMELARARGLSWLLQIDVDELFFSAHGETGAAHFQWADAQPVRVIKYLNYEAVPEKVGIADPFRDVDLFKVPPALKPKPNTEKGRALLEATPQLQPNRFHFYSNGKAAARLHPPGLRPRGMHDFDVVQAPVPPLNSLTHVILHYSCCGFDQFWQKYRMLGNFADTWFGRIDIKKAVGSSLHLEARDVVLTGDRDRALAFYRERIAIEDKERCEALIREGILTRVRGPSRFLNTG
jgi:hypothetical protein